MQRHEARREHFDLRLEVGGVLKSWAVPKGPSRDPSEKRLAVRTEDHPLEYADFEGVIPEGQYGAGEVILWDTGPYCNRTKRHGVEVPLERALDEGHVVVELFGSRLYGQYALTRIGADPRGRERWLLVKKREDPARARDSRANEGSLAVRAGGRTVEIPRPAKPLFPSGITKADLARYYEGVAWAMLPHVAGRPLMLERYPDGIEGPRIIQKQASTHFPDWVRRSTVPKEGGTVTHVVACDAATLVFLAGQACIALHAWLSRADRLDRPDRLVFDLDPGDSAADDVRRAACVLGALLRELGLEPFAMTTGSRGYHVTVPIQRRTDFDTVRRFARDVAHVATARDPTLTIEQRRVARRGRIFVDVMRNAYAQTAVAPYSVRARPDAPVATPLRWEELSRAGTYPDRWTLRTLPRRLARDGDPWADIGSSARALGRPRRRLERLLAGLGDG